jgi:hypothetical protein
LLLLTLLSFSKILRDEFSDIVKETELHDDRLKITFTDGSKLEVRYPVRDKYSFNLMKAGKIYRIDTAPHHREIATYPRHIHYGKEDNIIEDNITDFSNTPEENFRKVLKWVRGLVESHI